MAVIHPLWGCAVGKIGDVVLAVRNGQKIMRQYNPVVSNPNTPAQVQVRSKLKLLSQLSASLAKVIVIARDGAKSPRNIFTAKNYAYAGFADDQATFSIANVQLTGGARALTGFSATRTAEAINVILDEDMHTLYDKVVYIVIKRLSSGTIAPVLSRVQSAAGADGKFACELPLVEGDITVCAYGISFASAESREAFGNYNVESASDIARLVATKKIDPNTTIFSETRGMSLAADGNSGQTSGQFALTIQTATGSSAGSYSGAGTYAPGQAVTIVASANDNANAHSFQGWYSDAAGTTLVSSSRSYTFNMPSNALTLYAKYFAGSQGGDDEPGGDDH